jgi:hypothetical protein
MMRLLTSTALLASLALGAAAGDKIYTEWVTEYQTVNDCSPPSTTVTPCDICTPCVVTAWTQCITSTKTSTYPTSTYCAQPGWYDECNCQIDTPQWIWYDTDCNVEYICPYQDWYYLDTKVVEVVIKVKDEVCDTIEEQWDIVYSPTIIVVPTQIVTYIVNPTIIVVNDITINVTVAPTYITYTTDVTSTATVTATETKTITQYPSGAATGTVNPDSRNPTTPASSVPTIASVTAPVSTPAASSSIPDPGTGTPVAEFKLTTTIDGSEAVIMQQGTSLVLVPANDSTDGVAFTLTSTGELLTADGSFVSLTFSDGEAGAFVAGAKLSKRELAKRAIADGTYYGTFSAGGGFGMTIDGESVVIQACGTANLLSGSSGIMSGCNALTLTSEPVDTPVSSIPVSTPTSTPASTPASTTATDTDTTPTDTTAPESTPVGTGTGTGTQPTATGSDEPTGTGSTDGGSEPTNPPTNPTTTPPVSGGTEPTTTGNPDPSPSDGTPEPSPSGPVFPNGTDSNSTVEARKVRMARGLKFKYH